MKKSVEQVKKEIDEKKKEEAVSKEDENAAVGVFFILFLIWCCVRDRSRDRFYEELYYNSY